MNSMTGDVALRQGGVTFLPRDFVETPEGLLFAVVAHGVETDRALCFLRYVREGCTLRKVRTEEANELLRQQHGEYLFHSTRRDVAVHGVPLDRIVRHFSPAQRLAEIVSGGGSEALEAKAVRVARILAATPSSLRCLGVTGSLLVNAHHASSDIDLVAYGKSSFELARGKLRQALAQKTLAPLDVAMWRDAYERRGCSLTFDEYVWHEQRKLNKFSYGGTKVDISCVAAPPRWSTERGRKLDRRVIQATVTDDHDAFDYPARFPLSHPEIREILCYNPTYAGQARAGERVEASGWIEEIDDGQLRLVVGTSREATGEYINVLPNSRGERCRDT